MVVLWYWHFQNSGVSSATDCTFTNSLFWPFFREFDPATWCQVSTSLYGSFNPEGSNSWGSIFTNGLSGLTESNLTFFPWPLHDFRTSTTWRTLLYYQVRLFAQLGTTLATSTTHPLCTDFEEPLPRRFYLNNAGLFLNTTDYSTSNTSVDYPSQA